MTSSSYLDHVADAWANTTQARQELKERAAENVRAVRAAMGLVNGALGPHLQTVRLLMGIQMKQGKRVLSLRLDHPSLRLRPLKKPSTLTKTNSPL